MYALPVSVNEINMAVVVGVSRLRNTRVELVGADRRGRDRSAVHRVDDQRLGAFLDQRVDVRDLLGGIIVGDQWPDQGGVVLSRELSLIRDVVGPEVGVVEGQRNTERRQRLRRLGNFAFMVVTSRVSD